MSFPAAQQVNLPACSSRCPFNAERQAGKLRIPLLKSLFDPTWNQTYCKSIAAPEADVVTTRPPELLTFCLFLTRDLFLMRDLNNAVFFAMVLNILTTCRTTFSAFCRAETFTAAEALKFKQCIAQ